MKLISTRKQYEAAGALSFILGALEESRLEYRDRKLHDEIIDEVYFLATQVVGGESLDIISVFGYEKKLDELRRRGFGNVDRLAEGRKEEV